RRIAVEASDAAMRPVIEKHLNSYVTLRHCPHQNASVRRPVGPGFNLQLEVGESFVADQVRPQPRAGRILTTHEDAVFHPPLAEAGVSRIAHLRGPTLQRNSVEQWPESFGFLPAGDARPAARQESSQT